MCTNPKIYHRNIRKAFAFCGQRLSLAQILPSTLFHAPHPLHLLYTLLTQQIDWNLFFSGVWRFISFWCPPFLPLVSSTPHWKSISLRNYGFFHCSPFWPHPSHPTQYNLQLTTITELGYGMFSLSMPFMIAYLLLRSNKRNTDRCSNSVDIEIMRSFLFYFVCVYISHP